jgi:hypothetical protein
MMSASPTFYTDLGYKRILFRTLDLANLLPPSPFWLVGGPGSYALPDPLDVGPPPLDPAAVSPATVLSLRLAGPVLVPLLAAACSPLPGGVDLLPAAATSPHVGGDALLPAAKSSSPSVVEGLLLLPPD